jgi:hypothetical protein
MAFWSTTFVIIFAMQVSGGHAAYAPVVKEPTAMLALAIPLGFLGIGVFCWLLYSAAIYALPVAVGLLIFFHTEQAGAGVPGAILLGLAAGAIVLAVGKTALSLARSPFLRTAIALIFAIPAAATGYFTTSGLFGLTGATGGWRVVFAIIGAIVVGATAWQRLATMPPPDVGDRRRPASSWGRARRTRRWAHAVDLSDVAAEVERPLLTSTVTERHRRPLLARPQ